MSVWNNPAWLLITNDLNIFCLLIRSVRFNKPINELWHWWWINWPPSVGQCDEILLIINQTAGSVMSLWCHLLTSRWSSRIPAGSWAFVQLCLQPIGHQTHPGATGPAHKRLITHLAVDITVQVTWLEMRTDNIEGWSRRLSCSCSRNLKGTTDLLLFLTRLTGLPPFPSSVFLLLDRQRRVSSSK